MPERSGLRGQRPTHHGSGMEGIAALAYNKPTAFAVRIALHRIPGLCNFCGKFAICF